MDDFEEEFKELTKDFEWLIKKMQQSEFYRLTGKLKSAPVDHEEDRRAVKNARTIVDA